MTRIEWCSKLGNGALLIDGELFAHFPADVQVTHQRITCAAEAWIDGGGEPLTAQQVLTCLVASGLVATH